MKSKESLIRLYIVYFLVLFVGLGNPTPDSENNRHNVGFKIIDSINKKFGLSKQKPKQKNKDSFQSFV